MSETQIDVHQWNMTIDLLCVAQEFEGKSNQEYAVDLLAAYSVACETERRNPEVFKVNRMTRQKVHLWVKQFARYQDFVDGCWLLMRYYDTGNLLQKNDDTLAEMYRRWASLISLSMTYGNPHQIANFVPYANDVANKITYEMLRRVRRKANKLENRRPENWQLTVEQVKAEINYEWVFREYFPNMVESREENEFRAFCKWHLDVAGGKPNLDINVKKGVCHCKRCNTGFDVFGMIMNLDKVDFATALNTAWRLGK